MNDTVIAFLLTIAAGFVVLSVAGVLAEWWERRRRRDQNPTRVTPPSAVSASLPLVPLDAERQRRAFAWLQADLKAETMHAAKVEATLARLGVRTDDDPRRSQR